jgi:hypothetical protein
LKKKKGAAHHFQQLHDGLSEPWKITAVGLEQPCIISGNLKLSGVALNADDFSFVEPGEIHAVENLEDTLIFISFKKSF